MTSGEMTSAPRPAGRFFTLFTMPGATRRAEEESARKNPHLLRALEEEKTEGQRIATWARTIALAIVGVLLVFINPRPEVIYYLFLLLLFVLIGIAQLRAARVGQSRVELGLIFADIALLAITLAAPNPFAPDNWPTALQFKFEGFVYFFIFLAGSTLAYSWRTVQTIGMWTAVIWMTAVGLVAWFGKQFPELSPKLLEALGGDQRIFDLINPNSVILPSRIQEVVVFLIVAVILGLKSQRTNALLMRQAHLAAERANLSRYFPPSMVEELARRNEPMGGVRSQNVAVLFADVVGFTKFAENHSPEEVIGLLRSLHAALEEAVFSHGGTLDKYMGDGVMASFGTPSPTPADPANAVAAAFAMQDGVQKLNEGRIANGKEPVRLSVGVHYGPVILGDIGSERRMEFATLGDTVNVASRLEAATRELSCGIAISQSVIDAIAEPEARTRFCQAMRSQQRLALKGRSEEVDVWLA